MAGSFQASRQWGRALSRSRSYLREVLDKEQFAKVQCVQVDDIATALATRTALFVKNPVGKGDAWSPAAHGRGVPWNHFRQTPYAKDSALP